MVELERMGASPGGTVTNIRSLMSLEPHHVELERMGASPWSTHRRAILVASEVQ